MRCLLCTAALAAALLGPVQRAHAQAEDQAAARALFEEGRRLLREENYEAGCPKFEAARKLYPSAGTLLNLGDCYEHAGRTASAWTTFGEAVTVAGRTNRPDAIVQARAQQAALTPRLVRLAIRVARSVPGLVVRRDGLDVPQGAWGEAIPVDPGTHELRAEAAGYELWSQSIVVAGAGHTATVDIPELHLIGAPAVAKAAVVAAGSPLNTSVRPDPAPLFGAMTTAPNERTSVGRTQRIAGLTAAGAGAIALIAAGILSLVAKSEQDAATTEHGSSRVNDSAAAVHLANAATILVVAGGTVMAAGAILWLTSPNTPAQVGTNGHELILRGSF